MKRRVHKNPLPPPLRLPAAQTLSEWRGLTAAMADKPCTDDMARRIGRGLGAVAELLLQTVQAQGIAVNDDRPWNVLQFIARCVMQEPQQPDPMWRNEMWSAVEEAEAARKQAEEDPVLQRVHERDEYEPRMQAAYTVTVVVDMAIRGFRRVYLADRIPYVVCDTLYEICDFTVETMTSLGEQEEAAEQLVLLTMRHALEDDG